MYYSWGQRSKTSNGPFATAENMLIVEPWQLKNINVCTLV